MSTLTYSQQMIHTSGVMPALLLASVLKGGFKYPLNTKLQRHKSGTG